MTMITDVSGSDGSGDGNYITKAAILAGIDTLLSDIDKYLDYLFNLSRDGYITKGDLSVRQDNLLAVRRDMKCFRTNIATNLT